MAVKKNPDWHVWLGDILYWIRTPPGIYFTIIAVLGGALWFSLSGSSPTRTVSWTPTPPTSSNVQAPIPGPSSTAALLRKPYNGRCELDYFFSAEYNGCLPNPSFKTFDYGVETILSSTTDVLEALPTTTHYKIKALLGTISISYMRRPQRNRFVEQGYIEHLYDYAQISCTDCPAIFMTYPAAPP